VGLASNLTTEALYTSIQPRYPELAGQVALVTGSSRGIGKGIAIRLAREGMRVVINARSKQAVETTAAELKALGADVVAAPADVSRAAEVARLFDETLQPFGGIHLLVNNAANLERRHFFQVDEALLENELANNIRGPYLCAYRAAEWMRDAGAGNIVHISSVGGLRAHWRGLPYDLTKGAIDAMTRAMALELAEYNIRVNAIAPGATITERTGDLEDTRYQALLRRVPLSRFAQVTEIGAAVAFLASPDAAYITGQIIYVDGGLTAQLSPRDAPI
jgi:NAD(P)-dependent dehydrogenase (short-subunit alcohol dehydrogenase family)